MIRHTIVYLTEFGWCCLQAFEAETRAFLARPEEELQEQIAATKAEWEQVQSSSSFDQVIVSSLHLNQACNGNVKKTPVLPATA